MTPDWKVFLDCLRTYSQDLHSVLPPCSEERLETVQIELGKMPESLIEMLRQFNGARLFNVSGPLYTIFGLSASPPVPSMESAPDWYIDKFTCAWRESHDRTQEWAIGITNYGGLILLDDNGLIREWDTSQNTWGQQDVIFEDWISAILIEGDICLSELGVQDCGNVKKSD
jgi:hypothetical protein